MIIAIFVFFLWFSSFIVFSLFFRLGVVCLVGEDNGELWGEELVFRVIGFNGGSYRIGLGFRDLECVGIMLLRES